MAPSVVERYFKAMQRGRDGEAELVAQFAEDAVYVDGFSGIAHGGRAAIRAWLDRSWEDAGLRLTVDRVDVAGDIVETHWTCESPAFGRPARGRDRFTIRDGRIARLESGLVEAPGPDREADRCQGRSTVVPFSGTSRRARRWRS